MSYIADCMQKFKTLPPDIQQTVGGIEAINRIKMMEEKYRVELAFVVLLATIKEIPLNGIIDYLLEKNKISFAQAQRIYDELVRDIFRPVMMTLKLEEEEDGGEDFDRVKQYFKAKETPAGTVYIDEQEEELISEPWEVQQIFSSHIMRLLSADPRTKNDFNNDVILLITTSEERLQDNFLKVLYENQEGVTQKPIMIEGKKMPPTVSNWLKYFIKQQGSNIFDNIALSNFISNSEETKNLPPDEKAKVRSILKLYRNLKYFPDSQLDIPAGQWEIAPLDEINAPGASSPQKPAAEKDRMISTLNNLKNKYPKDSIEQKAIDEEMRKVRNKK